ncbi:hypothetical protein CCH79_00016715 [Gambusia affinis]|uniref:tRNA pseudouridine(55) synthase n=1 Tax=Gambusia affinis TaxID=33528 RepID=A0A315URH8_GAMAF|nr:hypothetical protein CCH79_00016715 [Gambusia affinis]
MAGNVSGAAGSISSLSKLQSLNGLFAIYKKQGPTSADVLNKFKETLLREAGVQNPNSRKRKKQYLKMGHGGTLDSAASGKYVAVGELGKATDTLDATGTVVMEKEFGKCFKLSLKHSFPFQQQSSYMFLQGYSCVFCSLLLEDITRLDMEEKLKAFTGDIMQVPPLFSALKKDGQRLSVLLKKGHQVEAKPARRVTVHSLTLQEFKPPLFTLDIECGGGFYVRSLVDDLGKALSSCAHVKDLVRTKQGQFTLQDHVLHEEQWTLQSVVGALQPCPEEDQRTDSPRSQQTPT